jgi:hypothetical protein
MLLISTMRSIPTRRRGISSLGRIPRVLPLWWVWGISLRRRLAIAIWLLITPKRGLVRRIRLCSICLRDRIL